MYSSSFSQGFWAGDSRYFGINVTDFEEPEVATFVSTGSGWLASIGKPFAHVSNGWFKSCTMHLMPLFCDRMDPHHATHSLILQVSLFVTKALRANTLALILVEVAARHQGSPKKTPFLLGSGSYCH